MREHWQAGARRSPRLDAAARSTERLLGYDIDAEALSLARYHAEQAGVAEDIHWQQRPFSELRAKAEYGCIITNPPYGERMGDDARDRAALSHRFRSCCGGCRRGRTIFFRRGPIWKSLVGQQADRRRKLYNGPLECTYYQFHGPRPPRDGETTSADRVCRPADEHEW